MLTQRSGGWPLTMFLTHDDQQPFFGGTYFPKEARYGLPAFRTCCCAWRTTTASMRRSCAHRTRP